MRLNQKVYSLGSFALQTLECGHITKEQLTAARNSVKKIIKKTATLWVRVAAFWPLTKKPQEVRMGKGKGSKLKAWVAPVQKGKIIMELIGAKPVVALACLRHAQFRLPIKSRIMHIKV